MKNDSGWDPFFVKFQEMENSGVDADELKNFLGKGRAKLGLFDSRTDEGELEAGQVAALINRIMPAGDFVREIMEEYALVKNELPVL
ncbi:MAG: hypothetical protein ACOYNC_00090 [Bacteroidales bacterium]